jgi:hypothetical protein
LTRLLAFGVRGLQYGHRAGKRYGTGISTGEESIAAPDADWAQGASGKVNIDAHATIGTEVGEGAPTAEPVAEGRGQITVAGDQGELVRGPREEGRDFRAGVLLARSKTDIGEESPENACSSVARRAASAGVLSPRR